MQAKDSNNKNGIAFLFGTGAQGTESMQKTLMNKNFSNDHGYYLLEEYLKLCILEKLKVENDLDDDLDFLLKYLPKYRKKN